MAGHFTSIFKNVFQIFPFYPVLSWFPEQCYSKCDIWTGVGFVMLVLNCFLIGSQWNKDLEPEYKSTTSLRMTILVHLIFFDARLSQWRKQHINLHSSAVNSLAHCCSIANSWLATLSNTILKYTSWEMGYVTTFFYFPLEFLKVISSFLKV